MADHGTVEYATATGNDYPTHEGTYESFVHFTYVGILHIICILFGLAVGGVMGHWGLAAIIFILALAGCGPGVGGEFANAQQHHVRGVLPDLCLCGIPLTIAP